MEIKESPESSAANVEHVARRYLPLGIAAVEIRESPENSVPSAEVGEIDFMCQ